MLLQLLKLYQNPSCGPHQKQDSKPYLNFSRSVTTHERTLSLIFIAKKMALSLDTFKVTPSNISSEMKKALLSLFFCPILKNSSFIIK